MRKLILFLVMFIIVFSSCKKADKYSDANLDNLDNELVLKIARDADFPYLVYFGSPDYLKLQIERNTKNDDDIDIDVKVRSTGAIAIYALKKYNILLQRYELQDAAKQQKYLQAAARVFYKERNIDFAKQLRAYREIKANPSLLKSRTQTTQRNAVDCPKNMHYDLFTGGCEFDEGYGGIELENVTVSASYGCSDFKEILDSYRSFYPCVWKKVFGSEYAPVPETPSYTNCRFFYLDYINQILDEICENPVNPFAPCDISPITGGGGGGGGGGTLSAEEKELLELEFGYKGRMTAEELKIYNKLSFSQKLSYLGNANFAENNAAEKFPLLSQHNSIADAYRHCLFSMLNVRSLGDLLAKELGDAHELAIGQPELEKQMDLFNNAVGRSTHEYNISLTEKAMSMVNSGMLVYIKYGILFPTNQ